MRSVAQMTVTCCAALLGAAGAAFGQASLTGLGFLTQTNPSSYAYGISADGSTVVGESVSPATTSGEACYLRSGTLTGLGIAPGATTVRNVANACSSNGNLLVGSTRYSATPALFRAYRYDVTAAAWVVLDAGGTDTSANACNAAGDVLAGYGNGFTVAGVPAGNRVACKWRIIGPGQVNTNTLGVLPGDTSSQANGTAGSGAITIGESFTSSTTRAFVHTQSGIAPLPTLTGGPNAFGASGISSDGSTIVGYATAPGEQSPKAAMWKQVGGVWTITDLGRLAGGAGAYLDAANANGTVLVGRALEFFALDPQAVVWTQAGGLRTLASILTGAGINLAGWDLQYATGISADGTKVVGWGLHNQQWEGFIATLPPASVTPCNAADVAGLGGSVGPDGQLTADDVVVYLAAFFGNNLAVADIAVLGGGTGHDGLLTADDIIYFLSRFFSPCNP
ncbi:MAG: GC-type dockerin domain-anchored protein [Phycisphaerales bacterium]